MAQPLPVFLKAPAEDNEGSHAASKQTLYSCCLPPPHRTIPCTCHEMFSFEDFFLTPRRFPRVDFRLKDFSTQRVLNFFWMSQQPHAETNLHSNHSGTKSLQPSFVPPLLEPPSVRPPESIFNSARTLQFRQLRCQVARLAQMVARKEMSSPPGCT